MPLRCRSRQGPFRRCELPAIHVFVDREDYAAPHKRGGILFPVRTRERLKPVEQLEIDVLSEGGRDIFDSWTNIALRRAMLKSHRTSAAIAIVASIATVAFLVYVLLLVPQP